MAGVGGGAPWQVWVVVEVLLGRCGWRWKCSAVMTEDLHKQFVNFVTVPDRVCRGTRSQGIKGRRQRAREREIPFSDVQATNKCFDRSMEV